jgi:hypothetical protein
VRRTEVVHADQHVLKIAFMLGMDPRNQLLGRDAFRLRLEHDGGAMRVIGANVVALVAAQLLKAHPNVSQHRLEYVAHVQGTVGVGECAGNQDSASLTHAELCHDEGGF